MSVQAPVRIAITGASGWIGGELLITRPAGAQVIALTRQPITVPADVVLRASVDLEDAGPLRAALRDIDVVIHLADQADRTGAARPALLGHLLDAAQAMDVRRVVYASSIFAKLPDTPRNWYGAAKRDGEQLAAASALRTIGLRLPPVYGPQGQGSFDMLVRAIRRGIPLPFGRATAPRSYLSLRNAADLFWTVACADETAWIAADGAVFEPDDGGPLSTRDLARTIGVTVGRPARLLPVPRALLAAAPGGAAARIVSAIFDPVVSEGNAPITAAFDWRPPQSFAEGLARAVSPDQ